MLHLLLIDRLPPHVAQPAIMKTESGVKKSNTQGVLLGPFKTVLANKVNRADTYWEGEAER